MKPAPFLYHRPTEPDEVLALLAEYGDEAVLMAGGQSLTPLLNLRMVRPAAVVDLNRVAPLAGYEVGEDHVTVGAMCRSRSVELDPRVREVASALPDALGHVGHPQIRNRGTIGGMAAFADPAAEIPAVLLACGGRVSLRSARGEREVEAGDFFKGFYETDRADDELVTAVRFDAPSGYRFAVLEHARRHGDYALAGLVLGLRLEERTIQGLRLCFFAVGPRPIRLTELEERFQGVELDDSTAASLAEGVESLLNPPDDVHGTGAYRRRVASVLSTRALHSLREEGSPA